MRDTLGDTHGGIPQGIPLGDTLLVGCELNYSVIGVRRLDVETQRSYLLHTNRLLKGSRPTLA